MADRGLHLHRFFWLFFVLVLSAAVLVLSAAVLDFDERVSWFENGSPR
jgi:hypothetical protein